MSEPTPPKVRILVAEDTNVTALLMRHALEEAGHEVDVARDGEECLEKVAASPPDLLLLDIMMPKLHGIEVLKRLRENPATRGLPVVMCSAKNFKTDRDEAMRFGAAGYWVKTSDTGALVRGVEEVLRHGCAVFDDPPGAGADAESYHPALQTARPHFTLWGTRGSTPAPGSRFVRHGGNTSCLSLVFGDEVLIFDAGSGIRDLGAVLMGGRIRKLHLFITHTHWDHIQGFPFFLPAYMADFEITIYGSKGFGKDLEAVFRGQLDRDYFPVQLEDMRSRLEFRLLPDAAVEIAGAKVNWEFTHHPLATVGYKVEVGGRSLVWMPDNEFLQGYTGPPGSVGLDDPIVARCGKIISFLSGVDVVIHEAQYTPEEYAKKIGWGHSSVANACVLMKFAGARHWIVTHHDPMHDDAFLETKLNLTRQILEEIGHPMQVAHGYDSMTEFL